MSEYAERDHRELGEHYIKHVSAMTGEGLHSKSAIAAELAYRDAEIERLRAENERMSSALKSVWVWLESDTDAIARDFYTNPNHIYESTAHAKAIIEAALNTEKEIADKAG